MKKALTKVLLLAVTLVIIAAIIPLSASASTSDNKDIVFKQLTTKLGFNPAAACGIMANIERESDFDPTVVIYDSNGLLSGGLCQWNGGRFSNLQTYCRNYGYDYLSIEGQIAYLSWEMKTSSYGYIYDYLKSVPNTADGAYNAAWYWCYYYEIPSNRATKAAQRGSNAENYYWPEFGVEDLKAPELSLANKKSTYDIDNSISFKWSDGGDDVTNYYLYVAEKTKSGSYDWANAKIGKYNASTMSKTVKPETLTKGEYAACVRAYNKNTGKIINSNFAKFTVKCLSHQCVNTVIENPTFEKEGKMLVSCKQCDATATKTIPVLTNDSFKNVKLTNFRMTGYNPSKIRLEWDAFEGADGYQVFVYENGAWKKIKTIWDPACEEYIVSGLTANTRYTFNLRAFKCGDPGKYYYSKACGALVAATKPTTPTLTGITQGTGSAKITWTATEGVDGYALYVAEGQDNSKFKLLKKIDGADVTSYTVTNLKKGQFYYFTIKSYMEISSGYATSVKSDIMYIVGK